MTPADLLQTTYALVVQHARDDARDGVHIPPLLVAVAMSGDAVQHIEVLDARQVPHQMRAMVTAHRSQVYGFVYVVCGTALYEQADGPPLARPALLCLWCSREAAGGDSYLFTPAGVTTQSGPLPEALQRLYRDVFDPAIPLPGMLTPTPH